MEYRYRIANLTITTWQGISAGAEHYYGIIEFWDIDKTLKSIEVWHYISEEEAKNLREKDQLQVGYSSGDKSTRFETEEEVIKRAISQFRGISKKYNLSCLSIGSISHVEPKKIIYSRGFNKDIKRVNNLYYQKFIKAKTEDEGFAIIDEWQKWYKSLEKTNENR